MFVTALLLAGAQTPSAAPACLIDGATDVGLTGMIGVSTAAGDPTRGKPAYRYATLTLDHPTCVRNSKTGKISAIRVLALVATRPNVTLPFRFKGHHSHVRAKRIRLTTAPDSPVVARLYQPIILPDD